MSDIRLLICHSCKSVQPIPWYDGPPQYDTALQVKDAEHKTPSGQWHRRGLAVVDQETWDNSYHRKAILEEIAKAGNPGDGEGLGSELYTLKATFGEDAIQCWKRHRRTTDCGDYKSDKMRLLADTRELRREVGAPLNIDARPKSWLCEHCPVHTIKQSSFNAKKLGFEDPYK